MKEKIYDEHINPLVAQIIALCKQHNIALIADFGLDDDMHCTTSLLEDESNPSDAQLQALALLRPQRAVSFVETVTTNTDGSKRISIRRIR